MVKNVYAVYDSKVNHYDQPFLMHSRGEALRSWITIVNDQSTSFFKYPEDFSLMELGEYDNITGKYKNHDVPVNLGLASNFKKPQTEINNILDLSKAN
jgi:hypothetical protein